MQGLETIYGFPGLVLLGIAVLVALRLVYESSSFPAQDELHLALTVVGRAMIAVGFVGACLALMSGLGVLFAVAAIVVAGIAVDQYVASHQASLLRVMAAATRKSIPLAPAVRAFSNEWRGFFGRRAKSLAELLEAGHSLPDALRSANRLISPRALALVETGARVGALAAALAAAAEHHAPGQAVRRGLASIAYVVGLCCVTITLLTFMMLKIVPAFVMILSDFETALPAVTVLLIDASNWVTDYWPVLFPAAIIALACIAWPMVWHMGWLNLSPPLVRKVRPLDTALILRALAVVAEAEAPLAAGMAALARTFPSALVQRRLTAALVEIDAGADWCESLREHRVLAPSQAALLASAARLGNLAWALREAADGVERRFAYRAQAFVQLLFPALLLAVGSLVMIVVVALFLPLVELIEALA